MEATVDKSIPMATLASPKGLVGDEGFAVVILLKDEAANIEPGTAETDYDDTQSNSPTISIANSWTKKDVKLVGYAFYKVEVDSDISFTNTTGDNVDEHKLDYEIELGLRPNQSSKWLIAYNYVQKRDILDYSNNSTDTLGKIKYSIDF